MSCGVGDYVGRLTLALRDGGLDVTALATRDPAVSPIEGVSVSCVTARWRLRDLPVILRAVVASRPDVVHVQYPTVGYRHGLAPLLLLPLLRVLRPRVRTVATLHEFRHLHPLNRAYISVTVPWAHALVTPDRGQLAGLALVPRSRIVEIPLTSNIEPAAPPDRVGRSELIVGTWGFLRPDKGIDRLIDAFPDVAAAHPARLVIAGDPGPDEAYATEIRARAAASPVADWISFTGRLPEAELSATLAGFDVCALPYVDGLETNRGTYATARAHGLPIVTTTTGEPRVDDAANTAFVRAGDRSALAEAILAAAGRPRGPVDTVATAWRAIGAAHRDLYGALAHREGGRER